MSIDRPLAPLRPLALALALLLPLLAGCGAPAQPPGEITGATGLAFASRPVGSIDNLKVRWDVQITNEDAATSAAARLHFSVQSSRTGMTDDSNTDIAPLPAHGTATMQVRTQYDGPGDYSGVAEILVGQRVVARAFVFFEQCTMQAC